MNIFEEIRAEHTYQRTLIDEILQTSGDSAVRRLIYEKLCSVLAAHAAAEERYFYKVLLDSDVLQDMTRHSIAEHKEIDDYILELSEIGMSDSNWLQRFKQLAHRLEHHLTEEEKEVFPVAGKVLSDADKEKLGNSYRREMIELEKSKLV